MRNTGPDPAEGRGTVPRYPLRQGRSGPASNLGGSETDFKKGVCDSQRRPPDPWALDRCCPPHARARARVVTGR
jgi:hypothetical protein